VLTVFAEYVSGDNEENPVAGARGWKASEELIPFMLSFVRNRHGKLSSCGGCPSKSEGKSEQEIRHAYPSVIFAVRRCNGMRVLASQLFATAEAICLDCSST
jgi:hypothetical protein